MDVPHTKAILPTQWHHVPLPEPAAIADLSRVLNTTPSLSAILLQRGIGDIETARSFFNPSLDQLHDPSLMLGMASAVDRVIRAIEQKELICIYGDYDVDGVTSVALLYRSLQEVGARVCCYLPDRHQEGYGVSKAGIKYCEEEGVALMIAIDCGIRAVARIEEAAMVGVDVIVCDHHEPGPVLPCAVSILNPKQQDCPYPFKELSGCGIGFKLLQALAQRGIMNEKTLFGYLDLVAVSIAADIVPIVDENRVLAAYGLSVLRKAPCLGLGTLVKKVNHVSPYTVSGVVFGLAPCINAAGRLSHANHALRLLLAEDEKEAEEVADLLIAQNQVRKELQEVVVQEAFSIEKKTKQSTNSLVLFSPGWHKGVLGIVAARCVEQFYKPTIILTQQGDKATGSGRTVIGYNMYKALQQCDDLLTRYGGHAYAAGLTLPVDKVADFAQRFELVVRQTITPEAQHPRQVIDVPIDLAAITPAFYNVLQRMRPFGPGFRQPVFSSQPVVVKQYDVYQGKHLALRINQLGDKRVWRAIGFGMAHFLPYVQQPLAIAYTIQSNVYQGHTRYALFLKDIKPAT